MTIKRYRVVQCYDGDSLGPGRRPISWDVVDRELDRVVQNVDTRAEARKAAAEWEAGGLAGVMGVSP